MQFDLNLIQVTLERRVYFRVWCSCLWERVSVCVWLRPERPECVFSTFITYLQLLLSYWLIYSVASLCYSPARKPSTASLSLSLCLERARGCCVIKQPDLTAGSSAVQLKHDVCWRGAEPRWERMSRTLLRIWTISRRSRRARVCFSWVMRLRFNMETESTCDWEVHACCSLHVCLLPWRRAAAQVEDGGRFVLTRPLLRRVCSGGYQGSWRGRRNTTGHGPAQTPTVCLSQQQQHVWTRPGPVNYQFIETETGSSASESLRLMLVCRFSELLCAVWFMWTTVQCYFSNYFFL